MGSQEDSTDSTDSPDNRYRFPPSTPWYPQYFSGSNGLNPSLKANEQTRKDYPTIIDRWSETTRDIQHAGKRPQVTDTPTKILQQGNKRPKTSVQGRERKNETISTWSKEMDQREIIKKFGIRSY